MELQLTMQKGHNKVTITCNDAGHKERLQQRYEGKGYKKVADTIDLTQFSQSVNDIEQLQAQYKQHLAAMGEVSDDILMHLHKVFDAKLETYKDLDTFLEEINNYAKTSTGGKLLYINFAKTIIRRTKI